MVREISGVTPPQLPNEVGSTSKRLLGTAAYVGNTEYVDIDAATEGAVVTLYIPSQWKTVNTLRLYFRGNIVGPTDVDITTIGHSCTDDNVLNSGGVETFTTTVNTEFCFDIDLPAFTGSAYPPGIFLNILIRYTAIANVTDIDFLGAVLTET